MRLNQKLLYMIKENELFFPRVENRLTAQAKLGLLAPIICKRGEDYENATIFTLWLQQNNLSYKFNYECNICEVSINCSSDSVHALTQKYAAGDWGCRIEAK